MSARLCVLFLSISGCPCVMAACSAAFGDCLNSTCCVNGNFGCYKRLGKKYAQCKPFPESGICAALDGWDCPGWQNCAANFADCSTSKCCKDEGHGCFKRHGKSFAQCRPKPAGICTDTADWRCPGWELCTDSFASCTHTHCCADESFTCYRKHNAYSQCLRTGECDPASGECQPVVSLLGQCSGGYQDCHQTACCQRGEDHCYLKNEGWGMCMPHCDPVSNPDWQCSKRELPSEKSKLTCDALKGRTNLNKRLCGALTEEGQCAASFDTAIGTYRPCRWVKSTLSCEPNGQTMDCDCALYGRGCREDVQQPAEQPSEEARSGGSLMSVLLVASLVVCAGSCGLCWMGYRMKVHAASSDGISMAADEQDEALAPTNQARRGRAQKKYKRADDEMFASEERVEDQVTL